MVSPWLQAILGGCALLLTLLQLATKAGWWAGSHSTSRVSDAAAIGTLALEMAAVRAWRQQIGDDPCGALGKLVDIHVQGFERRVTRLEARVFDGAR